MVAAAPRRRFATAVGKTRIASARISSRKYLDGPFNSRIRRREAKKKSDSQASVSIWAETNLVQTDSRPRQQEPGNA